MLSADAALVSAFAVQAVVHHKPVETVEAPATQGHFQDSITYQPDHAAGDIFEGVASQPVEAQNHAAHVTTSGTENSGPTIQASHGQSTPSAQVNSGVKTSAVAGGSGTSVSQATQKPPVPTSPSSSNTTLNQLPNSTGPPGGSNVSQGSTNQSVKTNSNGSNNSKVYISPLAPTTSSTISGDLYTQILNDIQQISSGGGNLSLTGNASLGGVITFNNLTVTLTVNSTSVTGVSITADSASLTLGGGVTSTINGISGSYTAGPGGFTAGGGTFSLTLGKSSQYASGSIAVNFSSFVSITATSASLSYTGGADTNVTLSNSTPESVSLLTVGISGADIVAGVNGTSGPGVELKDANLALALMSTGGTTPTTYYGVSAEATSLAPVGLPGAITVGAGDLNVQINGASDGTTNVVNFDSSFTNTNGKGLAVGATVLDYKQYLVQVLGSLTLGVTNDLQISGGFKFTETSGEVDIVVGSGAFSGATDLTFTVGPASNPLFSASGSVSMSFTATTFTINSASLTITQDLKIGTVVDVSGFSATLSNLSVDLATGDVSGTTDSTGVHDPTLTITAASATLFPGNTTITGSVTATTTGGNGFQGTFDLTTGALSVTLQQFHVAIGSVFTADSTDVLVTYDPTQPADQQLVQIGSGTLDFKFGSKDITGSLTNLIIYGNGFKVGSLTLGLNDSITVGSILSLTNPSVTLTNFAVTAAGDGSFTESGTLTVAADTISLNFGSIVNASATGLSVSVNLTPGADFGAVQVSAQTLTLDVSSVLSIEADNVVVNPAAPSGSPYAGVASATVTLKFGTALTLGGTVTDFSIMNQGGTAEFSESDPLDPNNGSFGISITASPGDLHLPSWLGIQITKFTITWNNFASDPADFKLVLSASITSITGLPGGMTVSASITDAVIDGSRLENGQFPITSIGSAGGSISGNLFGLKISAAFVIGIVNLNSDNQIVNADGTLTDPATGQAPTSPGSTTVAASVFYMGIEGGATIPGVGGVQIYLGFSQYGPLTLYLSAQFPLIIDPDSGLAIGGFSAGVEFDTTMPSPNGDPTALPGIAAKIVPSVGDISKWQQQLEDQTVTQFISSGGGTDLTAAYSQPLLILAGVTFYDAYVPGGQSTFKIKGNLAIGIDPSNLDSVSLLIWGTATFENNFSMNGYLYVGISGLVSGPPSFEIDFLLQAPAQTPLETIGGSLTFGFTDTNGSLISPSTATPTQTTETITLPDGSTTTYTATGFTASNPSIAGFYISLSGFVQYSAAGAANVTISGGVTLTVTSTEAKLDLLGSLNVSFLGDIATAQGEFVVDYGSGSAQFYGAVEVATGAGLAKLQQYGLTVNGAILFQINSTGVSETVNLPNAPPANSSNPITSAPPLDGSNSTPFTIDGSVLFDLTILGTSGTGSYATISYSAGGTTLFSAQGFLDIRLTNDLTNGLGLDVFVNINQLTIGSFLTFHGFGLLVINKQGLAAEITLSLDTGNIPDMTLQAGFNLVINTTGQDVTYTIPPTPLPGSVTGGTAGPAPGVTIYDSSGNVVGTVMSLDIPAGPPQGGLTDSSGTAVYTDTGGAGPYVEVSGSGKLTIGGQDLSGQFRFELGESGGSLSLSLVFTMSGSFTLPGSSSVTASVTGAVQISSAGFVALLNMDITSGNSGGSTTTNYGGGVSLTASFQFGINTTGSGVSSIDGVDLGTTLAAGQVVVIATGSLSIYLTPGTGFVITGTIVVGTSLGNGNSTLDVTGVITATVNSQTILTANVNGAFMFLPSQGGIAGYLSITFKGGTPLDGSGFSFSGTFDFELNTTSADQTVPVLPGGSGTTTTIKGGLGGGTAGPYAVIHANGTMMFGDSSNNFALAGDFYLAVGSSGLAISASVAFSVTAGGTKLVTLDATGALEITSQGLAAEFTLTVQVGAPSSSPLSISNMFSFSGSVTFEVNLTGNLVDTMIGSVQLSLPKGPYIELAIGTSTSPATLALGSSSTGLSLSGYFVLEVGATGLQVAANATLNLDVGGTPLFSLTADGALLINNKGIAAQITLTAGTSISGVSEFSFSIYFTLSMNTTGTDITSIAGQAVNLPATDASGNNPYFDIAGQGDLYIGSSSNPIIDISGSFALSVGPQGLLMGINGSFSVMGIGFGVQGFVAIFTGSNAGFALKINLTLGSSGTVTVIPGVLALSGTFTLEINTTNQDSFTVGTQTYTVTHGTLFDINASASFNVFGFSLASTTFDIKYSGGVFSAKGTVGFDFFGFATLTVDFYFDSNGHYAFFGYIYLQLGSDDFNIHGDLSLAFGNIAGGYDFGSYTYDGSGDTIDAYVPNGFTLRVDGGVTAFGYDFASIGASVTINNGDVSISAYVSVNLGLFSVGGTVTIDLGQISPPPAPPPPPQLGSMSGGTLTLNIGPNASNRTFNGATIGAKANEAYTITVHSVNGDGSEDLWVEAPGIYTGPAEIAETQTTISGAPAGTVEYDNVTSIVAVTGTSNTTLNFSGVNVPITITSGTGTNHYIFGGGSGAVTITGGGGNDSIIGGSGNVTFTANGGSGVFIGGTAQNAIINDPGTFIVIEQGYDHYDLNGTTLKYWNGTGTVYTDSITGPATVNLETPSTPAVGGDTLSFSVESLPSDFTLTLNGNGGGTVPVSVSGTGDIELNGTTVSVNGNNITLQGATEVTLIGTGAGDHLTANNSNFYSMVNMTGQAAGDSFTVNYQGSGSYAVNVNGSGSGNTLTINGTGADNIYTINGSPVSLGSETVAYSGVQNLVLNTYNGNDTVKIEKTAAATTVNGGSGNDTFNVQNATNPVTLNLGSGTNEVYAGSGANLDTIHALLTVTGGLGGTDTINLDDSANNSALTATLTTTSLTGVFGAGGSMNYSNIGTINLMLGNGLDVVNVQGMNGTVNIALGTGPNTLNIGSNAGPIVTDPTSGMAANTGSILDRLVGVLNFTGTGNNVINVDDSGGNKPLVGALTPTSIEFANLVVINLPNVVSITIALGQAGDTFVITDTAPTAPAVVDGDGGNDTFIVLDTHSTVTINGGDGDDNFYNFGNSGVLNLNGNDGNDSFFIYASVNENTTNLDPGGSNNKIYSYRLNNSVNINGGAGNNKLYIFGTFLGDAFVINGDSVTGAGLNVTFTNIQQLFVEGLGGNNTFYIESVTIPTTIMGNGMIIQVPQAIVNQINSLGITLPTLNPGTPGNNTFYVGWPAGVPAGDFYIPGSLATIAAPLTIYGDNGPNSPGPIAGTTNTVYVDDRADNQNQDFTLSAAALTSSAFGAGGFLNYDNAVQNLNIYLGPGSNTITVNGTGTTGAGGIIAQTSIYAATSTFGGYGNDTFIVNVADGGSLASPLALFGGSSTYVGDTLAINGAPGGNTFDITGSTIDGAGATIRYQGMDTLTVNASGSTTFNVNGDSIPTTLNGGTGNDNFNVNSNVVSLAVTGGAGNDSYDIAANAGMLTVNGGAGNGTFTVSGNSGTLAITGGGGNDTFTVNGNSGALTITGGAGTDSFTVNALSAAATLNGGSGNNSFTVNAPLAAVLTVIGGQPGDWLTVMGTTGNDDITITGAVVTGLGAAIDYSETNLWVKGVSGNDTFQIDGTSSWTTRVDGGKYGNDVFNVQATTGALTLTGSATGNNTFNLGSIAPVAGGTLAGLQGAISIIGGTNMMRLITLAAPGTNILNVDDSGDTSAVTGFLSNSTLIGLGMGGIVTFMSVNEMNISLGSGNDTFYVSSTNLKTVTNLNTGTGSDTINVGNFTVGNAISIMPLIAIQGYLNVTGGGDTLNLYDNDNPLDATGTLTPTTLTGFGMGASGIAYTGMSAVNLFLGGGADTLLITNTAAAITSIYDAGNDTINVEATTGALNLFGGPGTNVFNLGSLEPLRGGIMSTIAGAVNVTGKPFGSTTTVNVDDSGDAGGATGTLTNSTLTGLGTGGGLTYTNVTTLNIVLGPGNDTFNIQGTAAGTQTNLNTGLGTNTVNFGSLAPVLSGGTLSDIAGPVFLTSGSNLLRLLTLAASGTNVVNVDDSGDTSVVTGFLTSSTLAGLGMGGIITFMSVSVMNIGLGSGNSSFNVLSTNLKTVTNLNTGSGGDTVNVGAFVGLDTPWLIVYDILNGVQGFLNITGGGSDTLNLYDNGSTAAKTGTLTGAAITGLGMGASGIAYAGVAALNISLGSGDDTVSVLGTNATTVTTITNVGGGIDTFDVGANAPVAGGMLGGIQGALFIVGGGNDTMNVDDSGDAVAQSGTLTATTLAGLAMGAGGIAYSGLTTLNVTLGQGNDSFTITGVTDTTVTTIDGGAGTNTAALNFGGDFGGNLTLKNFAATTVAIAGAFTADALLNAPSIVTMTVGGDFDGTLNVAGLLNTLAVTGAAPGQIIAGDVNLITVQAGYGGSGTPVLNVTENGVQREVLATPIPGGAMPGGITFAVVYDSQTAADPQAAIRIITGGTVPARSWNLQLAVMNSTTANFNLSLVDSQNGATGVSNISIQGSLLMQVTAPELQFLGLSSGSRAGVVLPVDYITGVEISGNLPTGYIDVAGIEGLAFGTMTNANGTRLSVSHTLGYGNSLDYILGSSATLESATDAFLVSVSANEPVSLYAHSDSTPDMNLIETLVEPGVYSVTV